MSRLVEFGVKESFIVTGRGSLFLTDALAREPRIKAQPVHHEQSAGYAAIAAAVASKGISSCFVSTGVGSTNAVSAVLSAWQDEVPVVFISGQNYSWHSTALSGESLRTYGEQEANIVSLVKPITNYAITLDDPQQISHVIDQALSLAIGPRRGPVWIDIPLDFQSARVKALEVDGQELEAEIDTSSADAVVLVSKEIADLFVAVNNSSRPLVLLGSGAVWLEPSSLSNALAGLNIPVVYEAAAAGIIPLSDNIVVGSVGALGCSRAGNFALHHADLVIAIGSQFRSSLTGDSDSLFAPKAQIFLLDTDASQVRDAIRSRITHVSISVERLLQPPALDPPARNKDDWLNLCKSLKEDLPRGFSSDSPKKIDLYDLAGSIGSLADANCTFVTDSGFIELIIPTNAVFGPAQRLVHPHSQGAMGFALAGAIGVATATSKPVVAIIGDGSIMMNIQELETIRHLGRQIKIIVVSNGAYAIIRRRQNELFRGRSIGTDQSNGLTVPNFRKIANAFSLKYLRIDNLRRRSKTKLARFLTSEGPGLCEIIGLEDQDYIRQSGRKSESGAWETRPFSDLAPFLDYKFLSNYQADEGKV